MDYLKPVESNIIYTSTNEYSAFELDTKGYLARLKVFDGTLRICFNKQSSFPMEEGSTFEFVGKAKFCGNAEVHYILFDKV